MNNLVEMLLRFVSEPLVNWAKLEFLKKYIKATDLGRNIFVGLCLTILFLVIFLSGFIGLHVAFFLLTPWNLATKAWILLGLSVFYFGSGVIVFAILSTKKRWQRLTGLESLAKRWSNIK